MFSTNRYTSTICFSLLSTVEVAIAVVIMSVISGILCLQKRRVHDILSAGTDWLNIQVLGYVTYVFKFWGPISISRQRTYIHKRYRIWFESFGTWSLKTLILIETLCMHCRGPGIHDGLWLCWQNLSILSINRIKQDRFDLSPLPFQTMRGFSSTLEALTGSKAKWLAARYGSMVHEANFDASKNTWKINMEPNNKGLVQMFGSFSIRWFLGSIR